MKIYYTKKEFKQFAKRKGLSYRQALKKTLYEFDPFMHEGFEVELIK